LRGFAAVAVLLPALVVVTGRAADTAPLPAFADADNPALVEAGAAIYASHCALCHGEHLEGQPGWQHAGPDGRVLAPPHDVSGHTWQHSDDELFRATNFGVLSGVPPYERKDMPPFAAVLGDHDIQAVLALSRAAGRSARAPPRPCSTRTRKACRTR
jgi:mono/diheme cytochrome c family protein